MLGCFYKPHKPDNQVLPDKGHLTVVCISAWSLFASHLQCQYSLCVSLSKPNWKKEENLILLLFYSTVTILLITTTSLQSLLKRWPNVYNTLFPFPEIQIYLKLTYVPFHSIILSPLEKPTSLTTWLTDAIWCGSIREMLLCCYQGGVFYLGSQCCFHLHSPHELHEPISILCPKLSH